MLNQASSVHSNVANLCNQERAVISCSAERSLQIAACTCGVQRKVCRCMCSGAMHVAGFGDSACDYAVQRRLWMGPTNSSATHARGCRTPRNG